KANGGVLPTVANNALDRLVSYLEGAGHFARGEKVLAAQLGHPVHAQQRRWLNERLNQLYHRALQQDSEVSLGKGPALYRALNDKIQKDLGDSDEYHRYQLVALLCQVCRTAHEKKFPDVVTDLTTFAFKVLPPVLQRQTSYHDSTIAVVAQTVHDLAGARDGIVFLLNQIEKEPRWLRYHNQDGWSRHGETLSDWRIEAKNLGAEEG